jgi:hypothetical protein
MTDNVLRVAFNSQDNLVLALEDLLEGAREGRVVGVAAVYFESDNSFHTGYVGCKKVLNTIGAMEVLKQDYIRDNVEFE